MAAIHTHSPCAASGAESGLVLPAVIICCEFYEINPSPKALNVQVCMGQRRRRVDNKLRGNCEGTQPGDKSLQCRGRRAPLAARQSPWARGGGSLSPPPPDVAARPLDRTRTLIQTLRNPLTPRGIREQELRVCHVHGCVFMRVCTRACTFVRACCMRACVWACARVHAPVSVRGYVCTRTRVGGSQELEATTMFNDQS